MLLARTWMWELFDHLPVELIDAADVGVVVVQPHAKQLETVAAILDSRGPQCGRAGLEVAVHHSADFGLGNVGELVGEAAIAGVGVRWLFLEQSELEAHLLQCSEPAVQDAAMVRGHRRRRVECDCGRREHLGVEIVETAAAGQADERKADHATVGVEGDVADPPQLS